LWNRFWESYPDGGDTEMEYVSAVILAAGQGKRMRSSHPKVLHRVGGKPMLLHVCGAAQAAGVKNQVVIVGHGREELLESLPALKYVVQEQQLGTGHAVLQAKDALPPEAEKVLVLCGDTPLLTAETLTNLIRHHRETAAAATILTADFLDPKGYGRIVRGPSGMVERIVEHRDASPEELLIQEINSGTYVFERADLFRALESITPDNDQGEYYLTDVIHLFFKEGKKVSAFKTADYREVLGINDRIQLAEAEQILRERKNRELMLSGVTLIDPATTYIDSDVKIGRDTIILPNTFIAGDCVIGSDCMVGPNCRLQDVTVGDGSHIWYSVLVESTFGKGCKIGPFAYVRPGSEVSDNVKIGDFVEVKKSKIGAGSKVPHLTYVGDSIIGTGVNVGAGTITCNYDGVKKYQTIIHDNVFIGSNSNLVAPVEIGKGSYIAAGSTITEDVPEGSLAIARERQTTKKGWAAKKGSKKD